MSRAGLPSASVPLSGNANRRPAAGIAHTPSPATTTSTVTSGTRVTVRTHHRASRGGGRRRFFGIRGRNRVPANASNAGTSVTAIATASATATAAAIPIVVRNGMPATARPSKAITTVSPAKITADPAVAVARATDSSTSSPAAS